MRASKNGTFLFFRDYMDYHRDRFVDHSLLFYDSSDKLIGLFPANEEDGTLISHGGLTYGGIISDRNMTVQMMLEIFCRLCEYAQKNAFQNIIYKAIPHIYHTMPAEEDLYALFRYQARLIKRDVATAIYRPERANMSKDRKWRLHKGITNKIEIKKTNDFGQFMEIVTQLLNSKYQRKPVHSAPEMQLLADRFPENIRLFGAYIGDIMLGGVIVYESDRVAHAQYTAATMEGKEKGALDVIMDFLINQYYKDKMWFDFGISTEQGGQYLNESLIRNKQSYGGRAIVYDAYEICCSN